MLLLDAILLVMVTGGGRAECVAWTTEGTVLFTLGGDSGEGWGR